MKNKINDCEIYCDGDHFACYYGNLLNKKKLLFFYVEESEAMHVRNYFFINIYRYKKTTKDFLNNSWGHDLIFDNEAMSLLTKSLNLE